MFALEEEKEERARASIEQSHFYPGMQVVHQHSAVAPGDTRYLYLYVHHVEQEKDQVEIGFVVKSRCNQV